MAQPTRAELLAISRKPRLFGFVFVLAGMSLILLPYYVEDWWMLGPVETQTVGWLLVVAGWTLFGYVIGRRTGYAIERKAAPD